MDCYVYLTYSGILFQGLSHVRPPPPKVSTGCHNAMFLTVPSGGKSSPFKGSSGRFAQVSISGVRHANSLQFNTRQSGFTMQLKSIFAISAASLPLAIAMATPVMAQSTGTIETDEKPAIVVTGARVKDGVGGFVAPDSTKSRGVITQELIERQGAGQSILNTINQIPGVNFTNSDAYGSSGGNLRIRGFDGNRISLTFDGFPLNDSGNAYKTGNSICSSGKTITVEAGLNSACCKSFSICVPTHLACASCMGMPVI